MTNATAPVGIVAGYGELPLVLASAVENAGRGLYIAALVGETSSDIESPGRTVRWYQVGQFQEIVDGLKEAGINDLLLAGKIDHIRHMGSSPIDEKLRGVLAGLDDFRGSTILRGLTDAFEKEGFLIAETTWFVPDLLPEVGLLTEEQPGQAHMRDVAFGWRIAKEMARLNIGQTVVVKNLSVIAVEAVEGTDEAIRRAGGLAGDGIVAVKVSADDHDFRFDVPTVGPKTVQAMAAAGGKLLAVEAGKCILLNREEMLRLCRESGVVLVSADEDSLGDFL
jgi:UDP-2,3-diacylglucosamine hydrolase